MHADAKDSEAKEQKSRGFMLRTHDITLFVSVSVMNGM